MADTPEDTVNLFYDMFAKDPEEMLKVCCTEGIRWISPGCVKKLPWAACDLTGRDAVLDFILHKLGKGAKFENAEQQKPYIAQNTCTAGPKGPHVAVLSTCKITYNETGKSCQHPACHVFRFEQQDDKWVINWVKEFSDSAALERLVEKCN